MSMSTSQLLFALRRPQSHWLVAFVATLNEALQDPAFDHEQRELLCELLQSGSVPDMVAAAAQRGFAKLSYEEMDATERRENETWVEQPARRAGMLLADI